MSTSASLTPVQDGPNSSGSASSVGIPLIGILLVALVFRASRLTIEALWYDELWAASFSQLNWFEITMATLRFDIHPPAWNWQLQLWSFIDDGDAWLMLNSVLWGVGGVLSVFLIADRLYGRRIAWIAATLLAVMPVAVDMSRQVRPYAFLTVVVPWAWYCSETSLTREPRQGRLLLMGLLVLSAVYSHGSGILMAAYIGIAGLVRMGADRTPFSRIKRWAIAQALLVVLCLPAVVQSAVRSDAAHLAAPGLSEVKTVLSYLWFGAVWENHDPAGVIAIMATLAVIVCAIVFRKGRLLTLCFVAIPLLLSAVVSHLVKPMWFIRGFWFMAPFLCLAVAFALDNLARAIARRPASARRLTWAAASLLIVLGLIGSVQEVTLHPKPTTFAMVLDAINEDLEPGDVIYTPQQFDLWGFARYTVGPKWGSALAVQDLNPELAAPNRWGDVLEQLGPVWRKRLHLEPETCRIEHEPANLYVGFGSADRIIAENPKHIFLILRTDNPRPLPELPGYEVDLAEGRHFVTAYSPGFVLRVFDRKQSDTSTDVPPSTVSDVPTSTVLTIR